MPDGLAWLGHGTAIRTVLLLVAGYVVATVAALLILIAVVATLPASYFRDAPGAPGQAGSAGHTVRRVARNLLGVLLIALGVLLSLPLVPGQGVLTMLVGALLVDFPGKRRLEQRLVRRPHVLETLNRVRAWLGKPPFA
jgi:hypothetical protein